MANVVMIMGASGTGKSSSIKTLNPKETVVINVLKKRLPFKGSNSIYNAEHKNLFNIDDYATIAKYLKDFHGELDFYNKSCQLGKASACFDAAISKENNQDYISIYNAMHDACSKGSGRACELIAELINNPNDQMSVYNAQPVLHALLSSYEPHDSNLLL